LNNDATKWTLEEWKEWCLDLAKDSRCPWCGEVLQRTPLASGTWYFSSCQMSDDYFGLQGVVDDSSKAAFSRWHNSRELTLDEISFINGGTNDN